jgi:hypothetical protein
MPIVAAKKKKNISDVSLAQGPIKPPTELNPISPATCSRPHRQPLSPTQLSRHREMSQQAFSLLTQYRRDQSPHLRSASA